MKVSVFGLGYVGSVTMGCLARDGHQVVGVDVNAHKVELVGAGQAPIIELGLSELLARGVAKQRLRTTTDCTEAIASTEVSFISVGTPTGADGSPNMGFVYKVAEQIGAAVRQKGVPHTVVLRSTVLPGTTEACAEILQREAGPVPTHVAFNPEFLREGSAIKDFDAPPYTIIGTEDDEADRVLTRLYSGIDAPVLRCKPGEAELLKAVANAWHATKITFANEVGRLAKASGVDGRRVMELICEDRKLNVSRAYMRPGFAYGGSCLPKDVRALVHLGAKHGKPVSLLSALGASNAEQVAEARQMIEALGVKKVALLGLSFKPGTDDLRESPAVALAEQLRDAGYQQVIYDPTVASSRLIGRNKAFIDEHLPHLSKLLTEDIEQVRLAEVVVVCHGASEFSGVIEGLPADMPVVDLAGLAEADDHPSSQGICW